jgi:hypothetical protein
MAQLSAEVQSRVAEEDEALLEVEAQLPEETTRSTGQNSRLTPLRTTSTSLLHQLLTITRQEDPESQQSLLSPSLR